MFFILLNKNNCSTIECDETQIAGFITEGKYMRYLDNNGVDVPIRENPIWDDEFTCSLLINATQSKDDINTLFEYVKHEAVGLKKMFLYRNPLLLPRMNQTDELCRIAIRLRPSIIMHVDLQTIELCLLAIRQDPMVIQYIAEQTFAMCEYSIMKTRGEAIRYILNQTDELSDMAIQLNPSNIRYVKIQKNQLCLKAVSINGLSLQYITDKTCFICLIAVKQCGEALKFVEQQTKEICLEAIKQHAFAYVYVLPEFQSSKIKTTAIKKCPSLIQYIK
jgi:hypothetical protein